MHSCVPERWRPMIRLHDIVESEELLSRIAEHDIGFAGEQTFCRSRDLTVTNKILHYLLGGLAVVASDTAGQREVAAAAPEAVTLYAGGDAVALAAALDRLLSSPAALQQAQAASLRAAQGRFRWETIAQRLVQSVEAVPVLYRALTFAARYVGKPRGYERLVRRLIPPELVGDRPPRLVGLRGEPLILADPRTPLGWNLLFFGTYEPELRNYFRSVLQAGFVAVDVGANVGWHTLLMAQCVGDRGRVLAFEPNPSVRDRLQFHVSLNRLSQVDVLPFALTNRAERLPFNAPAVDDSRAGDGCLMPEGPARTPGAVDVDATSLDALLPRLELARLRPDQRLTWKGSNGRRSEAPNRRLPHSGRLSFSSSFASISPAAAAPRPTCRTSSAAIATGCPSSIGEGLHSRAAADGPRRPISVRCRCHDSRVPMTPLTRLRLTLRNAVYPGLDLHTRHRAVLCRFWKTGRRDVLDAAAGNG